MPNSNMHKKQSAVLSVNPRDKKQLPVNQKCSRPNAKRCSAKTQQ